MRKFLVGLAAVFSLFVMARPVRGQIQGSWVNTGNLNIASEGAVLVPLGSGKALLAGGANGSSVLGATEIYDPATSAWKETGALIVARENAAGVVLTNGKVLVVGGLDANRTVLASTELYDPATGKWSKAAPLLVARIAHSATVLKNGKVLVAGGCTTNPCGRSSYISDSELYDPVLNRWTKTGNMLTARGSHTATLLHSGEVLAVDGSDGSALSECEHYNPSTGKWQAVPSTLQARLRHTATLLESGKVLVSGGVVTRYPLSSAELYDPAANRWTVTGSMTTARYAHTATLLGDGTVLVAGGEGQAISCGRACTAFIPTAKTEIYNEATGKFSVAANLNRARAYHSATLLGTGWALVGGGLGTTSICCVTLNSAEDYAPLTLKFSATSLNFGFREVGTASSPEAVTVTNVSFHSATFASIASTGDFAETNSCPINPSTFKPGQSCSISVTFKPTANGTRNGGVILKDNSPGSPQQTITATGTGEPYSFAATPTSLTFPTIVPGASSEMQVTVLNDSAARVSIASVAVSPANGTFRQTNNCPATLLPGGSCTVMVVFTPPDAGDYTATLSVTDGAKQTETVELMGAGSD
jgi:N-acetylneuraminic acid mutarotase